MAAIIDYITAPFAMLHDAIDAFRPDRPPRQAPTLEYAVTTRHQGLDDAMRKLCASIQRLESTMNRLERLVDKYLVECERKAEQRQQSAAQDMRHYSP